VKANPNSSAESSPPSPASPEEEREESKQRVLRETGKYLRTMRLLREGKIKVRPYSPDPPK